MFKIFNNLFDKYQAQMQEYNSLTADEKKEQKKPRFVEIVFNDITIEKVASNLQYNPKGATLIVDELKGFFNSFSMYNEGSNAEQKYLSLFNGSNLIDSRITRDTVVVSNPHLSIIGTTQPDVIYKTFNKATDNGMKERFLFVCPDAQPTKWSTYANKEIRAEIQEKWAKIIDELFFLNTELWANSGKMKGVYIRFEREAEEILREWQADNVERQKKNLKSASMLGKADIICPRLALILSLIENPKTQIISSQNAYRAVNLMEYFIKHNHKVLQIIKKGAPSKPSDKRRLFDALPDNFTTAEAIDVGLNFKISQASVNRYLRDENFCTKIKHGHYEKV